MKKFIVFLMCVFATTSSIAQAKRVDSLAVTLLDRMTEVIGEMSSVGFTLKTRVDEQNQDLGLITNFTTHEVYFNGNNQLLVRAQGSKGKTGMWYNSDQLFFYSFDENNYAVIDTPPTTIEMISEVHDKYEIDFPAADFFYPNLTDQFIEGCDEFLYAGRRKVEDKDCFYIIIRRKDMTIQLWLANDAYTLPVKVIMMYHTTKDGRQYEATFSDWQINPFFPEAMFKFQPPPEAHEIILIAKN
jgi:hypothetical protein